MSLIRTLYDIFFQDSTHYSVGELNADGSIKYSTVKGIPSLSLIEEHILKLVVLGAYTVSPGNTIRWIAWDIDSKVGLEKAREIAKKISDFLTLHGIPHAIEFSGSKGYHIYIFLSEKCTALRGKVVGESLREFFSFAKSGKLHVEVYPKQSELAAEEVGSLLRLPLGRHPKSGRDAFFVNTTDWEDGDPIDPEIVFDQKTTLDALEKALEEADPLEKIANLLIPYWESGQRHDIALRVAGMAATSGWTKERTCELIEIIHESVPEGSLDDQLKAVESTFKKYANGESVLGENGLTTIIPAKILMNIRIEMGSSASSLILQTIDAIRLDKNPPFIKVRQAARTSVAYFLEHGRLVRDESENIFWLNHEDHQLTMIESHHWERLAHNLLGVNLSESFGRQLAESIRHMAYDAAKIVKVAKRSFFDKEKIIEYINLGGPEIYILDGDEIRMVYNGEIDILFRNSEDTMLVPNLLEEDNSLDPWKMLIEDMNFVEGETTVAQLKQLLIAYVCCMFFPEAMPTRPLLLFLGDPGSGKTTAARRILWAIEGVLEEVMGQVPDKADALRASLAAHRMVVIDNIEKTKVAWLPDTLNRVATGTQIELRQLHTTNRVQKILFNVFVAMTGTEIPFSEETVYTRILPITLKKLDVYSSEGTMRSNIANNFNSFWKGLLTDLNKVVAELRKNKNVVFPSETRLADFSVFCNQIKDVDFIDETELMGGLGRLVNSQKETLKDNSPFVSLIDSLIKARPEEMSKSMTMAELYAKTKAYAAYSKQPFEWSTSQGLSKHVAMLESSLKKEFGMVVKSDREGGREVKKYKFIVAASVAAPVAIETKSEPTEKLN